VNSPPPTPEVILTNFFAEPTVLLVPITSRGKLLVSYFSGGGVYISKSSMYILLISIMKIIKNNYNLLCKNTLVIT
jgi:hypothetical protein